MPTPIDYTSRIGQRYGRLTVVARQPSSAKPKNWRWRCVCDCGGETFAMIGTLTAGHTRSCGCLHNELTSQRSRTHGKTFTREWRAWMEAKTRCFNPNRAGWDRYGGRGITMAPEWRHDFEAFLAHVGPCPVGHSLDRISTNGNYEPGNVRWATRKEQRLSASHTIKFRTLSDELWSLSDVARWLAIYSPRLRRFLVDAGALRVRTDGVQ